MSESSWRMNLIECDITTHDDVSGSLRDGPHTETYNGLDARLNRSSTSCMAAGKRLGIREN